VVGPKTIPSSNVTATNGNNNLVSLLKKAVTLLIDVFKFILSIRKSLL
jgi:hypothetical protein